ncbi:MAG: TylF/MycF/NovP-related O-methyltransferase [Ktedonobacteraceae bacterium]
MQHSLKVKLKHAIPPSLLNTFLLRFPFMYRTKLICYETNLQAAGGVTALLAQMATVLDMEGEIIECGSSRCGASIIMANYLRTRQVTKKIFACDSFEGFDRVELRQEQKAGLTTATSNSFTSTSYQYVQKKIAALGFQDIVIPVKGYFQDTLPNIPGPFCLALIDCDLRDSLVYSAETIWPNLSNHGCILFDDYLSPEFKGAKQGVDIFVEKHQAEISDHGLHNRLYYVRKV